MTLDELDSIITQGEKMGIYMYIYSGGEPLVRKKDIITLCEMHPDCQFLAFTNATLIDEQFANEMLRVRNFVPAISVEGFEAETDFRRGEGTYQKVIQAMELLKRKKLVFGISCCYTSKNIEVIGSEAYFDKMIDLGAKFAWFFTYIPVGKDAVPELMTVPWPPMNFVAEWTTTSAPCSMGRRRKGVAKVLSTMSGMPCRWATAEIASMSMTSEFGLPSVSA